MSPIRITKWVVLHGACLVVLAGVLLFLRSATFLFWAIEHGRERVAKLAFLAIASVNARGPENRTPLMEAKDLLQLDAVALLRSPLRSLSRPSKAF